MLTRRPCHLHAASVQRDCQGYFTIWRARVEARFDGVPLNALLTNWSRVLGSAILRGLSSHSAGSINHEKAV